MLNDSDSSCPSVRSCDEVVILEEFSFPLGRGGGVFLVNICPLDEYGEDGGEDEEGGEDNEDECKLADVDGFVLFSVIPAPRD